MVNLFYKELFSDSGFPDLNEKNESGELTLYISKLFRHVAFCDENAALCTCNENGCAFNSRCKP
jgi:hypothetical protein